MSVTHQLRTCQRRFEGKLGAPAHEVQDEHDHRDDEEDVDQSAGHVEGEEAEEPKDDEEGGKT